MNNTFTYPTRTAQAMPYELLLAIWLFLCGGLWGGFTALLQNLVVRGLCVLQMCCKSVWAKYFHLFIRSIEILPIFVVQNQFIKYGANSNFNSKEPKNKGAREFQKLISFLSLRDRLVLQRAPLFINQIFFKMQNQKREKSLSVLREKWAVAELEVSYKPKQKTGVNITGSYDAYQVFLQMWDNSLINIQEQFACLFLNAANEVIGYRLITTGKATSNTIDFNFIITCALLCRAQRVIFAHNHPSGNIKPSKADKDVTFAAKWKLEPFEVDVTDHLIITDGEYYSFIDNGLILKN